MQNTIPWRLFKISVELVAEGEATFRDFMLVAWPTDNRPRISLGTFTLLGKEYSPKQNCYNNERQTVRKCFIYVLYVCVLCMTRVGNVWPMDHIHVIQPAKVLVNL